MPAPDDVDRRAECRVAGCPRAETFPSVDALDGSDWTRLSIISQRRPEGWTHLGYCPDHALGETDITTS